MFNVIKERYAVMRELKIEVLTVLSLALLIMTGLAKADDGIIEKIQMIEP